MTHLRKLRLALAVLWACFAVPGVATHHQACAAEDRPPTVVQVGERLDASTVPPAQRRGTFLSPQAVSAVDVGDDSGVIAVGTMAFRHDRNFFVLSAADGKVLWGRYVEPWAPFQVAALGATRGRDAGEPSSPAFAAGMAYARQTEPFPVVSLFRGAQEKEAAAVDDVGWDRGVLRYGGGDWRTGWPASLLGDVFARGRGELFTIPSHDGTAWRWGKTSPRGAADPADAAPERFALGGPRPFRMTASADGRVLAVGYLVPDVSTLDDATRSRLSPAPPGVITALDAATARALWSAPAIADAPAPPRPPEPADDFPELAESFNIKPQAVVPFRVAASVSASADGSRVAATEYAGWMRVRRERLIGYWSGHGQAIAFCPRGQRGRLRIFGPAGKPVAQAELPREGLFDVRLSPASDTAWCVPTAWFARGAAGCAWLPADGADAHTVFVYDIARQAWSAAWRFPDAVADVALHPNGERSLVSCWDGRAYLVGRDGAVHATIDLGGPARLRWSGDGAFAVAGTEAGDVFCIGANGKLRWKTGLPVAPVARPAEPLKPVFDEVPVYSVGRVGPEHAYVGDTWLIKTDQGGILVDAGGTSGIPLTLERIRASGIDPGDIRYVLLSHTHGDHLNAVYLWRARGAEVVAPASAAFGATWVVPQWNGYGISAPCPIDRPLPLRRAGDEAETTLCGVPVKAIFAPGHSVDSVVYLMELNGRRVIFTGDIAFDDRRGGMPLGSNILHRCWNDRSKAEEVVRVIEQKVLPLRPEFEFKGHASHRDPVAAWQNILGATRKALQAAAANEGSGAR